MSTTIKDKSASTMEDKSAGIYWETMSVVYKVFRFLGFMPFGVNRDGIVILSSSSKYWALISCAIQVALILRSNMIRLEVGQYWKSYDQVLESLMRLLLTNTIIFYLVIWNRMPKIIKYINGWKDFTAQFEMVTMAHIACFTSFKLKIIVAGSAVFMLYCVIADQFYFQSQLEYIPLVATFLAVFFNMLHLILWGSNCFFIMKTALSLRNSMKKMFKGEYLEPLDSYRMLWLELRRKVVEFIESFQDSTMFYLVLNHLGLVLTSYTWMTNLVYTNNILRTIGLFTPLAYIILALAFLCETSQLVKDETEEQFIKDLLHLRTSVMQPRILMQVELFLDTIEANSSGMVFYGCISLSRKFAIHLVSITLTYVIVLMQFDVGVYFHNYEIN